MILKKRTEVHKVANQSFNGKEIETLILDNYAMNIDLNEIPIRFYQASMYGNEGLLLSTDKRLLFIGEDEEGRKVGVDIPLEEVDYVENYIHEDRAVVSLIVMTLSGFDAYEFIMTRFGFSGLLELINESE